MSTTNNQQNSGFEYESELLKSRHEMTELPWLATDYHTDLTLRLAAMVFPYDSRWDFELRFYEEEKEKTAKIADTVHKYAEKGDPYAQVVLEAYELYVEYIDANKPYPEQ